MEDIFCFFYTYKNKAVMLKDLCTLTNFYCCNHSEIIDIKLIIRVGKAKLDIESPYWIIIKSLRTFLDRIDLWLINLNYMNPNDFEVRSTDYNDVFEIERELMLYKGCIEEFKKIFIYED